MEDITVQRYTNDVCDEWNIFCDNAKNAMFLFNRNYMDYHSERFKDHSLMFFTDGKLIALLPMNEENGILYSHGGLTYGGFLTDNNMKQHYMDACVETLKRYMKDNGIKKLVYKAIPHIFHLQPAEEDRYAFYINGGSLVKAEASTVINLKMPIRMSKGRKAQVARAKREGVVVKTCIEKEDFIGFIELENRVLLERHNTIAVHSGEELFLLYTRFPDAIHLFAAKYGGQMIAGVLLFEYQNAIHTQYMAADNTARRIGALDLAVATVIDKYKATKFWLDFGKSTERDGRILNEGLIGQKEKFGGRTNIYETWELS